VNFDQGLKAGIPNQFEQESLTVLVCVLAFAASLSAGIKLVMHFSLFSLMWQDAIVPWRRFGFAAPVQPHHPGRVRGSAGPSTDNPSSAYRCIISLCTGVQHDPLSGRGQAFGVMQRQGFAMVEDAWGHLPLAGE
jgi:hypothetical protein